MQVHWVEILHLTINSIITITRGHSNITAAAAATHSGNQIINGIQEEAVVVVDIITAAHQAETEEVIVAVEVADTTIAVAKTVVTAQTDSKACPTITTIVE